MDQNERRAVETALRRCAARVDQTLFGWRPNALMERRVHVDARQAETREKA